MIITALDPAHFGKLKNVHIPLREGLNILTGENESGKTTIAVYIKSMLFGIPKDSGLYSRFLPYDFEGVFGGSMDIVHEGVSFRIARSFVDQTLSVTVLPDNADAGPGSVLEEPEAFMRSLTGSLSETDYIATGFLSQDGFREDDEKWKETEEKTALREKEEELRERFETARELLSREISRLNEDIDPTLDDEIAGTKERYLENDSRISELNAMIRRKEQEKRSEEDREARVLRLARDAADKKSEEYKNAVLDKNRELKETEYEKEHRIDKPVPNGMLFIVLGAVAGFLGLGYALYENFDFSNILMLIALIAGGAVFAALLVLGIIFLNKKNHRVVEARITEEKIGILKEEAKTAEDAYQAYLLEKAKEEEALAAGKEESDKLVAQMQEELTGLTSELEGRSEMAAELTGALQDLNEQAEKQEAVRFEIKAAQTAMDAMTEAGKLDQNKDELSVAATAYLSRINADAGEQIQVDPAQMIHLIREGKNISVSDLSTAAAQEVLLSVRFSMLDEKDPEKLLPVVLDDVFASFDTDRLNAGMKLVKSLGRQVVLLTCQTRERGSL